MKAVIVGAGALGLGFLAERMAGNYQLYLADTSAKREDLATVGAEQRFSINTCGLDGIRVKEVTGRFDTVLTDSPADRERFAQVIRDADLVLTCTARKVLDGLVDLIAPEMAASAKRQWLLFCENGIDIAGQFSARFGPDTTLVDTVMSRMCRFADAGESAYVPMRAGGPVSLVVEDYDFMPLDGKLCSGGPFSPAFAMVAPEQFRCWEDIKLYLHNGMHAFVSYHACLEGVERLPECPAWIREKASRIVQEEVAPAIAHRHTCASRDEIEQHGLSLLERFVNPHFSDTVARGIRGIRDKLAPGERLVGGCEYIRRAGIEPVGYASTVEAARKLLARETSGASVG